MAFLNSSNIKVFPCGGRNKIFDPLARLTTEYNLVSLINRLVDRESFIVTTHLGDIANNTDPYIINIKGYLFTIDGGANAIINSVATDTTTEIYAKIKIDSYKEAVSEAYYQQLAPIEITSPITDTTTYSGILDSGTETSKFTGIEFTGKKPDTTDQNIYYLKLFEKTDVGSWVECEDSKIKFETNTSGLRSVKIDDGII